jgi:hypothetical protein
MRPTPILLSNHEGLTLRFVYNSSCATVILSESDHIAGLDEEGRPSYR